MYDTEDYWTEQQRLADSEAEYYADMDAYFNQAVSVECYNPECLRPGVGTEDELKRVGWHNDKGFRICPQCWTEPIDANELDF